MQNFRSGCVVFCIGGSSVCIVFNVCIAFCVYMLYSLFISKLILI